MIVARWIVEKLIAAKDEANAMALQVVIDAKNAQIAAREHEIAFMRSQLADITTQAQYERARADAAVDRLLVRDAKVYPVAPAATAAMEAAKREAAAEGVKVERIFESMNTVGEDGSPEAPHTVTFPGGGKVLVDGEPLRVPRPPKLEAVAGK